MDVQSRNIVGPTSERQMAILCIEGEIFHIDITSRFDDDWGHPENISRTM